MLQDHWVPRVVGLQKERSKEDCRESFGDLYGGKQLQPITTIAHLGIIGKASVFSITSMNSTQIIDIGASNHIIRDASQLQSVILSPQTVISTTNGNTGPIIGEGFVILSKDLTLHNVLVIPSLENNMLSVSQITFALACTVTFLALVLRFSVHSNSKDSWLQCQTWQILLLGVNRKRGVETQSGKSDEQ